MTTAMTFAHCQAAQPCEQPACFQARLEARIDRQPVSRTAELCAEHLSDVVHDLTAWADGSGLTDGFVAVLILDAPMGTLPSLAMEYGPAEGCMRIGTIPLNR